jgi:spermidine/putrescine-binding protein
MRLRDHAPEELCFYSKGTTDIEFLFPFGWGELWGIADRTDYDLTQHINTSGEDLTYFDDEKQQRYTPYVVEPSLGADRVVLAFLCAAYDEEELAEAMQLLIDQKTNINPTYGVDNLKDKMASGEMAASVAWSGDHIVMLDRIAELGGNDDIDLRFVLPEGSNWSVDMMCIPSNAANYEGAHDFINFMYEPEIALENCEYVGYSTPNVAAKAMLDPEVSGNVYYYPTEEIFSTLEVYYSSSEYEERYTEIWNTVKASN